MDDTKEAVPFETFEGNGKVYHAVGLLQLWQRGYTAMEDRYADPPIYNPDLLAWLEANGSRWVEFIVGPPTIEFPDAATAERFREVWHEPGEARKIAYYASDEHKALVEHNHRVLRTPSED